MHVSIEDYLYIFRRPRVPRLACHCLQRSDRHWTSPAYIVIDALRRPMGQRIHAQRSWGCSLSWRSGSSIVVVTTTRVGFEK